MPQFDRHVFVCTNERAADNPRGSCKAKGGIELRDYLKKALSGMGLAKRIRANTAGCLDQCEHGIAVVVYPEQVWYTLANTADVDEIVAEHLLAGRLVSRLLMPEQPQLQTLASLPTIEPQPLIKIGRKPTA